MLDRGSRRIRRAWDDNGSGRVKNLAFNVTDRVSDGKPYARMGAAS